MKHTCYVHSCIDLTACDERDNSMFLSDFIANGSHCDRHPLLLINFTISQDLAGTLDMMSIERVLADYEVLSLSVK